MRSADELNRLGADLYLRGDSEGARLHYLSALRADPAFMPPLANLAIVLANNGDLASAEVCQRKILEFDPNNGNWQNNLGNILTRREKFDEAEIALRKASEVMPEHPGVWHNLALLFHRIHKYDEALSFIDRAMALGKTDPGILNDRAHMFMAKGDLVTGFELYENRWHTLRHLQPWDYHIPEWRGEALDGKHILFHAEQGFGDTIMTSRFAKDLVNLGARVTMALPENMVRLFKYQKWENVEPIAIPSLTEEIAKQFDFQSPMYSAMRWLDKRPENISPRPYLRAPDFVQQPLNPRLFNVGICWASGQRGDEMDWRRRVSPLELWLPLSDRPNIQLYSLFKGSEEEEIPRLGAEALVEDRTNLLSDWADTAVLVSNLDLVVTVDTAIGHLAGALGKPVIMLSQFSNCWRWWDIDGGTGRPWYETMGIRRQPKPGDWKSVLDDVHEALPEIMKTVQERRIAA